MVYIYAGAAFFIYFCIYFKTRDWINPIGLGAAIWLLCAGLASYTPIYDYSMQNELAVETHLAIWLAAIFFSIPAILSKKNYPDQIRQNWSAAYIYFTKPYYWLTNSLAILSIVVFLVRFSSVIFEPALLAFGSGVDLKSRVPSAIPFLHYIEYLTPYIALVFIFEMKFNLFVTKRRRVFLWLYVIFSIATIVVYKVSRDDLVILLSGWFCVVYYASIFEGGRIKLKSIVITVMVFLSVLAALGLMRISSDSRVSTQFGGSYIFLSQMYTYIAFNFQNLNSLVVSDVDHTYVWAVWRFVLKYFHSGDYKSDMEIVEHTVSFFNAKTFVYDFYHDMGLLGVAFYSFVIGSFLQLVYGTFHKDVRFVLMISFLLKAVLFMFFGNYFFVEFILFFPYVFSLLIILLLKTEARQRGHSRLVAPTKS